MSPIRCHRGRKKCMFLLLIIVTQKRAKRCVFPPRSDKGSRQDEAEAEEVVLADQNFRGVR